MRFEGDAVQTDLSFYEIIMNRIYRKKSSTLVEMDACYEQTDKN